MKRNRRPTAFGKSQPEIEKRSRQMAEAAQVEKTGLFVDQRNTGWAVIHYHSNLPVVKGLRQRRFAEEAISDLLDTGVDFTKSTHEVQSEKSKWKKVYYRWESRARQFFPDPMTFEYYPHNTHSGSIIPSAEKAAQCRELARAGRTGDALDLLGLRKLPGYAKE